MLIVRTYVWPSKVHGLGVFAKDDVKAGTHVWEFDPTVDAEIDLRLVVRMPAAASENILNRCFKTEGGKYILSRDNGVFINHSDDPNTLTNELGLFAARDIQAGEEITENYRRLPSHPAAEFLSATATNSD